MFRTQSLLIYKVIKNKRGLKLVTSCSSGFKTSSEKFFISYRLSDQVSWCNMKQFLNYFKNYICKFMQASSWHHKLFQFQLSFWTWKVWKGRGKIQKCEYLQNENSFLDETNSIFHSFWTAIIWWKIKNLIKNSGHKL